MGPGCTDLLSKGRPHSHIANYTSTNTPHYHNICNGEYQMQCKTINADGLHTRAVKGDDEVTSTSQMAFMYAPHIDIYMNAINCHARLSIYAEKLIIFLHLIARRSKYKLVEV